MPALGVGPGFLLLPTLILLGYESKHVAAINALVKDQQGVALEVYVFGPAEKALADPARRECRDTLITLVRAGVPVHVCRDIAERMGKAQEFIGHGFTLEYARDAFVRYALEGATVVSF